MAGHNKWSKVKHKKGASDALRSKLWTKISREITVSARLGGSDPASNSRLRKAMDDARSANMPKDTMLRAITKATQSNESENYEELVYEGYGPAGSAILIECMTDNRNRTLCDVRVALNKNGGKLGAAGSVSFGFKKKGLLVFDKESFPNLTQEELMEMGLEAGLEDIEEDNESFSITCEVRDFLNLKDLFISKQLQPSASDFVMVPDNWLKLDDENSQKLTTLLEKLEDLDDVQKVWSNVEL